MDPQSLMLPLLIVLVGAMLFFSTRKQRRAVAEQQKLQSSLRPGDRVMTTSGLYGTVVSSTDNSIDIEIAPGVVTSWLRAAVREKVADSTVGTPADDYDDDDTEEATDVAHTNGVVEDAKPAESAAEIAPPLEQSSKKAR